MSALTYTGKGGYVWKEPVETKHSDGTSSFTLGFRVCKMMPEVGDAAAITLAKMLNAAECAEADAAIKEGLLAALAEFVVLGHGKCTIGKAAVDQAQAAIAKALGQ